MVGDVVEVRRRGRDGPVAQLPRDDADVHALGAEFRGVRVPQAVGGSILRA